MSDTAHRFSAPIASRVEAYARLIHAVLDQLWYASDFQPDGMGCCHICCAPCAALYYLDCEGILDPILAEWPEGARNDKFVDGRVDRTWMYAQWTDSVVQQGCGHRREP